MNNRIDKETDICLYNEHGFFNHWLKADKAYKYSWIDNHIDYCILENNLGYTKQQYRSLYLKHNDNRAKYINSNIFNVSSSFLKNVKPNVNKIIQGVSNLTYYKVFGETAGHLVFDDSILLYSILPDSAFISISNRNAQPWDTRRSIFYDKDEKISADKRFSEKVLLGLAILILKHFGNCETTLVAGGVKRNIKETKETIVNKAPFKVRYLDCAWLRTIVHTDGVLVRGFFRWQACGIMWQDRKYIYVQPFERHYERRAGKCKEQEPEIKEAFCQNAA